MSAVASGTTLLSAAVRDAIDTEVQKYPQPRSALLIALHLIQGELGYVPLQAQREVAAVTDPDARALLAQARVVFLDGNAYTSRPGPRLVEGTELLAELIGG